MASKKASTRQLLEALARERGIDVTDLDKLKGSGVKGRLQEGAGFKEAFVETGKEKLGELKENLTTTKGIKRFGKKVYMNMFGGDDIFSAYMRGRIKPEKTLESKDVQKTPEGDTSPSGGMSEESQIHLKILAQNSMGLHMMARDVNVMRQNLQELVKVWGGKKKTGADAQFNTKEEKRKLLESESADERAKDVSFFEKEDQREAALEAARGGKEETAPTQEKEVAKDDGGGFLDTILSMFSSGFMKAIRFIFNPKNIMKVFSKVFVPVMIIGSLFSGIMDGFKKYKEGGSFTEVITSALGGMLKFLTFGLFGEDTLKSLFDSISSFFDPITTTISNIFTGIKDFFIGLFGGKVQVKDEAPKEAEKVKPKEPSSSEVGKTESDKKKLETPEVKSTESSASPSSSSPTPAPAANAEPKVVEKISGTKLKIPSGVTYDNISKSFVYKGIYFTAHAQEDLDKMKKSIDDKSVVEFQGKDEAGKSVTIKFDGASGSQLITEGKPQSSSPTVSSGSSAMGSAAPAAGSSGGGGGGGSVSSGGGGGGSSGGGSVSAAGGGEGGSVSASPSAASGGEVSSASSQVAESQRMESAADQGSIVNSPTTNNTSSSSGQSGKPKSSDVYDSDLANILIAS